MSRCVVVIPCYNEEQRFSPERFEDFAAHAAGVDFLLVNDGSRDGTRSVLERLAYRRPHRFRVLHLERNSGKAEAIRQGFLSAFDEHPTYIGFWDADLATALEEIPRFIDAMDRHDSIDAVVGARFPLLGRKIERRPLRRLLGRAFATVASTVLGLSIYDTQCGAKLFRVNDLLRQAMHEPFGTRWIFDVEIFARLIVARRIADLPKLCEVVFEQPLDAWREVAGSKLKRGDFVKAFAEMAGIYRRYLAPFAQWRPQEVAALPREDRRAA